MCRSAPQLVKAGPPATTGKSQHHTTQARDARNLRTLLYCVCLGEGGCAEGCAGVTVSKEDSEDPKPTLPSSLLTHSSLFVFVTPIAPVGIGASLGGITIVLSASTLPGALWNDITDILIGMRNESSILA